MNNKLMTMHPDPKYLLAAIEHVKQHIPSENGGPFGACIVKNTEIISFGHNTVISDHDPTAHAEINAIKTACQQLKTHDLHDCVIYSTTEPCPMCFSAIHWANIPQIVYGSRIQDVEKLGFRELTISNQQMKSLGNSQIELFADVEREKCLDLLNFWQNNTQKKTY